MIGAGPELAVLNALDEGVVAIDEQSRIIFFSRSAERMFGYDAAEIVGQPLELLIPEGQRVGHGRHVAAFRHSDQISRPMRERAGISGRRKDGSVFDAEASINRTTIGGHIVLMAVVRDVTERKRAEARLRNLEQRQRAILETCGDPILLIDAATNRVVETNSRAALLFGCELSALVGSDHRLLFRWHPDENVGARVDGRAGRGNNPEALALRHDGSVVPVEVTRRADDIDGRPTIIEFLRDVSYHKAREEELTRARETASLANESKTRFLANMSHELRTPLNAVIGMSELIRDGFWGPIGHPKYVEYANDINDSGRHLLDLINDILDLSRIELGKVALHDERVDVDDLLDQCRRTMHGLVRDRRLAWARTERSGAVLLADRRAVRQMLLNLLSNAIKHTGDGGTIALSARVTRTGGLTLTVSDSGSGIAPERLPLITQPFNLDTDISVSRQGGAGLGLTITKRLVELHDGELLVDSEVGRGTKVHLAFPRERVNVMRVREDALV